MTAARHTSGGATVVTSAPASGLASVPCCSGLTATSAYTVAATRKASPPARCAPRTSTPGDAARQTGQGRRRRRRRRALLAPFAAKLIEKPAGYVPARSAMRGGTRRRFPGRDQRSSGAVCHNVRTSSETSSAEYRRRRRRESGGSLTSPVPSRHACCGLIGRGAKPPPQFGHTFCNVFSTQSAQNVHS